MFCKNCGNSIDDSAVVCPHCGVQVGELKPTAHAQQPGIENHSKSSNVVGLVGFILAMVGVVFWIVGLFVGFFMFLSIILSVAGVACSAIGMKNSQNGGKNRGTAIAGLVVSVVTVSVTVFFLIIGLSALSAGLIEL